MTLRVSHFHRISSSARANASAASASPKLSPRNSSTSALDMDTTYSAMTELSDSPVNAPRCAAAHWHAVSFAPRGETRPEPTAFSPVAAPLSRALSRNA